MARCGWRRADPIRTEKENSMNNRRAFVQQLAGLAGLGGLVLPGLARAQSNLETARILVGFPAGGTTDAMARKLADRLRGNYAANVLVENKPGAGGQIGVSTLRDSVADGSVLLMT